MKPINIRTMLTVAASLVFVLLVVFVVSAPAVFAAEGQKTIKLKYGTYGPKNVVDEPILWFIDEVSKRSGVNIEIETYYGGILAKPVECLGALTNGIYDIGWISPVFTPAETPLAMIPNATPLVAPTLYSGLTAADELINEFQPAGAEFSNAKTKFLFHSGVWHYQLFSTKSIKTLEEIKGVRVRSFGYLSKAWAELGGNPVAIPIPEIYDALQKGVLDAVLTQPYSAFKGLRLCEVAKNYTRFDLGCLMTPVLMPLKTWKKLPKNVQEAMLDLARQMPEHGDRIITRREMEILKEMKESGIAMYEIPPVDIIRIQTMGPATAKILVDDLTSKGVEHAKEAMDIYLKAIEKAANNPA